MRTLNKILMIFFSLVFLACASYIGYYYYQVYKTQNQMDQLEKVIKSDPVEEDTTQEPESRLAKFKALYEMNPDIIGWLEIEGTKISYPVMQRENDAEFYLEHDFEGRPNANGVPFLDEHCSIEERSTNLLLHGHNMRSGLMFAGLMKYKKESYYKDHSIILFDTLYEEGEYEIVSVFLSKISEDGEFEYYRFVDAETEEEFDDFISNIKRLSLYDTGVEPEFGDELITLSTCEYSNKDGRMAVVARKITKEE